jgi:demethylmenaquinone methyltransferase/2-methoxy-6-polyprenyl-1,4-benzoquinol methylase
VGLDFSAEMLKRAVAKRRGRNPWYVRGDALRMPFADASFDACTVGWGVRNFEDTRAGLSEILRILRPGGRLAVLEFARPTTPLLAAVYSGYMKRVMRAVGDAVSRSRAYGYLSDSVGEWHDEGGFVRLLEEAGFGSVEAEPLSGGICHLFRARRPT